MNGMVGAIFAILIIFLGSQSVYGYFYSQGEQPGAAVYSTSISTDKATYSSGEPIAISGEVNQYDEKRELQLAILDPGTRLVFFEKIKPESDGTFSVMIIDTEKFTKKGEYTIRAQYGKSEVEVAELVFSYNPSASGIQASAESSDNIIPDWIRNNAKWWADGQIEDSDFVKGIEYMIKQEIISIGSLPDVSEDVSEVIPGWIKNNAGWWADGLISGDDFTSGIKWFIENGLIRV